MPELPTSSDVLVSPLETSVDPCVPTLDSAELGDDVTVPVSEVPPPELVSTLVVEPEALADGSPTVGPQPTTHARATHPAPDDMRNIGRA